MAIAIGGNQVNKAYLGTSEVQKMYLGSDLVFDNTDVSLTPIMTNFRVENATPTQAHFDTPLGYPDGMDTTGFEISGKTISSVTKVDNASGYFTVSAAFDFFSNNTIRLGEVTDASDQQAELHNFTLEYITNNIAEPTTSNERFVAVGASGGGLTIGDPMGIEVAWAEQLEDTTYWCAPGNYGDVYLSAGGTNTTGFTKFIGYKTNPTENDITSRYYNHGDGALDPLEMPLLTGTRPDTNADEFVGMTTLYGKQNYIVKNFQLTGYGDATKLRANNSHYENIITKDMGEDLPEGDDPNGGRGIFITHGSNIRALNCYAEDCSLTNFSMMGIGNMTKGCESHGNGGVNQKYDVDYFYQIDARDGYTLGHNILIDSYAKRHFAIQHEGHGVSIQTPNATQINEYNLVDNCTFVSIYQAIEFRHEDTRFNVAKNIHCYAEGAVAEGTGGVVCREAAHDNVFENSRVIGTTDLTPIKFYNDFERGSGMGSDNIIRNNIFQGTGWAIHMREWTQENSNGDGNKIYNNTFDGFSDLFTSIYSSGTFTMTNCEFKNNIVQNVTNYEQVAGDADGWTLDYNNFFGGMAAEGTNASTVDPNFIGDYVPQGAIILAPRLFGVEYDYNEAERATITTIGGVKNPNEVEQPIELTPILYGFRVGNINKDRVYFDVIGDVTGLTFDGFEISGKTIDLVGTSNGVPSNFRVTEPFTYWDQAITIRLGENSDTFNGVQVNPVLHNFTLSSVYNSIDEPTATVNRYVAVGGSGDGTSEGNAASLATMETDAVAGQTWWIKAGDYGNTTLSLSKDGTTDSPIKYIGYKTTIGDITANYVANAEALRAGWSTAEFPTLIGVGDASGTGVTPNCDYVILRNFQTTQFREAVRNTGNITNVVFERFNSMDNVETEGVSTGFSLVNSIQTKITVRECFFLNHRMAGLATTGNSNSFNLFENNSVYKDSNLADQDYWVGMSGSNNIIRKNHGSCNAEISSSHGMGIKAGDTESDNNYNLIELNEAYGLAESYYLRNSSTYYNVVKDNYAEGISGGTRSGGFYFWGGTRHSIIERNKFKDLNANAIRLQDNAEGSVDEIGAYNILRNNIFDGADELLVEASDATESLFNDNKFYNNTFMNIPNWSLWSAAPWDGVVIQNLEWTNNIFENIPSIGDGMSPGQIFTNNNFNGCWTTGLGTGDTNLDPQLDANYLPANESLTKPKLVQAQYDYNSKERAETTTIGGVTLLSEE